MGLFDNIQVDETAEVEEQKVSKVSSWIKDSGAYTVEITMMRFKESKGGATGFVMEMETEDGARITKEEWFTNKEGGTQYVVKDKKTGMPQLDDSGKQVMKDLPGMSALKSISKAVTGNPMAFMTTVKKVVPIYDYESKGNVDTEVDVASEFIGKTIEILVEHTLSDKTELNKSTNKYEPVAKVQQSREIVAFVDPVTHKTFSEAEAGKDADAYKQFMENIEANPIRDKRKVSANVDMTQAAAKEEKKTEQTQEDKEKAAAAFA